MINATIGEILELKRGYDLTKEQMENGPIPVVGSNGIIGYHNISNSSMPCVTIGRSGTVGIPHIYNKQCWVHNTALYINDCKGNNPYYLYYLLKNTKIDKVASSTGVPTLNRNFVYPLKILFHNCIKDQNMIANCLLNIDNKIITNNQINSELESLAKTIYDYWFLQFEFPNEEGKPYKSSGGKMVWNDELKREIPEGWEVKSISEIASLYQPKTISGDEILQNGKYLVYGANGIVGTYNEYNHEDNEIAICCRGASCGDYLMTLPKSWITGNAMVVSISDAKLKEFVFYGLSKERIAPFISGSAQPQITRTNLENMKLIMPAYELIDKFGKMSVSYRKQIENNAFQCQELASLRDFLLPMLMNGQVTFKD